MAKASHPTVGLDIGSTFIKVVEISSKGGHPEITAVGIMPTPPDAVIQGLIIDPPAMGAALRHLLEISGVKSRRAVSSIAGANNVTVRIVEVPKGTEKDLADTMKYEIDRFVPFAHGQQIERSYQALPIPAANEANQQVVLAVAVQDVVSSHVQALQAAGLESIGIEVEPLALARSLAVDAQTGKPLDETVGIVSMGAASTELSVVTGGMLIFPRTISIGGDTFTRSIAENLGMRVDAAERMKRQYASVDPDRMSAGQPTGGIGGGGMADFGSLGEPDLAAPPFFDFNAPPTPTPSPSAVPGLNPFLYGNAPPGGSPAQENPFELPGFAPAAEAEPDAASVFDLGPSSTGDMSELFPTQISRPAAHPSTLGPAAASVVGTGAAPGVDLGGFDLGEDVAAAPGGAAGAAEDVDDGMVLQVQEMISPVLGELVTELRRSLEYYKSHNQNLPMSRLILCGGCARMPNIGQFLENELGISVVMANPLANVTIAAHDAPAEWLGEIAPVLSIAVGLAEREMVEIPKNYVPRALAAAA